MIGILLIVLACGLWALDTLIRYPLLQGGVDAFSIVFYEHLFLSIIFLVVFFKSLPKLGRMKLSHIWYFFIIGGVGSASATLAFTHAFNYLNPSLVIILQKFQPVVSISLAHFVLKEKIKKEFLFWASICLIGAVIISYDDILKIIETKGELSHLFFHSESVQGYLLVAYSVVGWGAATVFGKKLLKLGYQDEQVMGGRFIMGLIILLPFVFINQNLFSHSVEVYGKVSLMIFVSGLLAMYLFYQGLRKVSARSGSLAELFFPFMAVIVNWIFLDAVLTPVQIVGGCFLLLGSVTIQLKHY